MKYDIKYGPSYSMLVVSLEQGEQITGEAGAMTYMSPTMEVRTRKREQSILGTLATALIGRQSFFARAVRSLSSPPQ